ncbi:MAG: RHS repeat-associated core domain-containing protein [Capsulimonadaceae bacterium]|nr:RHS repeat-associated core domain-containing protein [Capsulimonadaceae bacterium]
MGRIDSTTYLFDIAGNTRQLWNAGRETPVAGYLTDAFGFELLAGPNGIAPPVQAMGGEPMMGTAGRVVNNLRFGGQYGYYRDGANRLYVRARVYRADWGRWLSVDPAWGAGGEWNAYRYAGNNPVGLVSTSRVRRTSRRIYGFAQTINTNTSRIGDCVQALRAKAGLQLTGFRMPSDPYLTAPRSE